MPNAPGQPGVQGRWLPGTPKEEELPDLPGTERQGGGAPRLCVFLMALTAGLMAMFWFLPAGGATGVLAVAALCLAGFTLYGPQALTGVTATNTSTKLYAGTSIGFISLFSYIGVAVSGKVCGSLAQATGAWRAPVLVIAGVAAVGAVLFLLLWNVRANSYNSEK